MIMITVVAMMCHFLEIVAPPVCHEVIVIREKMSIQQCLNSHAAIAEWKDQSIYNDEEWYIREVMCENGTYQLRDGI